MTGRATSAQAYAALTALGIDASIQAMVLACLGSALNPMTANEIVSAIKETCSKRSNSIRPRVTELFASGLIAAAPVRACTITGEQAQTWRLWRAGDPAPPPRAPSQSEALRELQEDFAEAVREITRLRRALADAERRAAEPRFT